jgi:hypothetical protein
LKLNTMNIRQDATRQVEQAKMLHRQGRLAEAMATYGDVLARYPRWFEPHYLLALANTSKATPQKLIGLFRVHWSLSCARPRRSPCWPAHCSR